MTLESDVPNVLNHSNHSDNNNNATNNKDDDDQNSNQLNVKKLYTDQNKGEHIVDFGNYALNGVSSKEPLEKRENLLTVHKNSTKKGKSPLSINTSTGHGNGHGNEHENGIGSGTLGSGSGSGSVSGSLKKIRTSGSITRDTRPPFHANKHSQIIPIDEKQLHHEKYDYFVLDNRPSTPSSMVTSFYHELGTPNVYSRKNNHSGSSLNLSVHSNTNNNNNNNNVNYNTNSNKSSSGVGGNQVQHSKRDVINATNATPSSVAQRDNVHAFLESDDNDLVVIDQNNKRYSIVSTKTSTTLTKEDIYSANKKHVNTQNADTTVGGVGAVGASSSSALSGAAHITGLQKHKTTTILKTHKKQTEVDHVGKTISEGHTNFNIAYNMLTGIRISITKFNADLKEIETKKNKMNLILQKQINANSPGHSQVQSSPQTQTQSQTQSQNQTQTQTQTQTQSPARSQTQSQVQILNGRVFSNGGSKIKTRTRRTTISTKNMETINTSTTGMDDCGKDENCLGDDIQEQDFHTTEKLKFVNENSLLYSFKFKDYAPKVFSKLRKHFEIDDDDYLQSLTSKYVLSELNSPGKSGSFFYYSRDYKYIIKTIHHSEHEHLQVNLKEYFNHCMDNKNTLVSQFYGLYRLKLPISFKLLNSTKTKSRKIYFIVMNNVFPMHIDQTFDLKGSLLGRYTNEQIQKQHKKHKQNDLGEVDIDDSEQNISTFKDLNWLQDKMSLNLDSNTYKQLYSQLHKDVALLIKLNIMDYSLLIGIHDIRSDLYDYGFEEENGILKAGILNSTKDKIYFIGIIDCLTNYSLFKHLETWVKSLTHNKDEISAIPPDLYGKRFLKFITNGLKEDKKLG